MAGEQFCKLQQKYPNLLKFYQYFNCNTFLPVNSTMPVNLQNIFQMLFVLRNTQ